MISSTTTKSIVDRSNLALPQWTVSDELLTKFDEFNGAVDEFLFLAQDHEKASPVDGDASSLTIEALRDHRYARQDVSLQLAQSLVELFARRTDLLAEAGTDLTGAVAAAEKRLATSQAKVRQQLEKAGLGAETQPGWASSPGSSAIKFTHLVGQSTFVRTATAEHHDLKIAHELAREYSATNKHNLAAARAALDKLVSGLVS